MRRIYEISYWIKIQDQEPSQTEEKIQNIVSSIGGEIIKVFPASKKELAYPIGQEKIGYFGYLRFSALPETISQLDQKLKEEKSILRFCITKTAIKPSEISQDEKINQLTQESNL